MVQRIHIAGAPIDVITAEDTALLVYRRLKDGLRTRVASVNAAIINLASNSQEFQRILEGFDLILADGLWPALAGRCLFRSRVPHATTSLFLKALFQESSPNGLRVFLLGARREVVKRATANLPCFYPNAIVVGCKDGYFKSNEETNIVNIINKSGAEILLLGMSSPKKEFFIQRYSAELNVSLSVGVGGLFDIWAGDIKEVPNWMRTFGFEWLFRLCQEPRRLWKRYTVTNARFIWLVILQALRIVFHKRR